MRLSIFLAPWILVLAIGRPAAAQADPAAGLASNDPAVLAQAIEAVGVSADRNAIRALGLRIDAGLPRPLLLRAVEALEASHRREAAAPLTQLAQHRSPQVRARAAHGLGALGASPTTQRILIDLLDDPDERVRAEAATALGTIDARPAMEPLISAAIRGVPEAGIVVGRHGNAIAARRLAQALAPETLETLAPAVRLLLERRDVGDPARRELAQAVGAIPGHTSARLLHEVEASLIATDRILPDIAQALTTNAEATEGTNPEGTPPS